MHRPFVLTLALTLAACSAPQHLGDEYRNVPRTTFAHDGNTYRIFDKPSAGKLVVTPTVANAMSDSLLRKMTFGTYGNAAPKSSMEAAVAAYLTSSGRKCAAISAALVHKPQWEFTYSCEIKYTATE
jgi:hypothetical protein